MPSAAPADPGRHRADLGPPTTRTPAPPATIWPAQSRQRKIERSSSKVAFVMISTWMSRKATPGSRSDRNIPSSEGVVVRFSYRMVPEVYQMFWAGMAAGEFINDAAIAAGSYRKQGTRWLAAVGGSDLVEAGTSRVGV